MSGVKEFTIGTADDGRRLDRWIRVNVPSLPISLAQKFMRLNKIKLNGKAAKPDDRINAGDVVRLFIEDSYFEAHEKPDALLSNFRPHIEAIYEDENILLVDKRPGLLCHPDETEKVNTLVTHVCAYLYQKGEGSAHGGFMPVLVNRIDRFTGGIVICAKTEAAMHVLSNKIRSRELEKSYLCIAEGDMRPPDGIMDNYILKSQSSSRVKVFENDVPGSQHALTQYRTLARGGGLSLVECTLVTGRTHQIRAQMAHAGHPLMGDLSYGARAGSGRNFQALYSYRLRFDFKTPAQELDYLNGREFHVPNVPFVKEYFPNFKL